MNKWPFAKNDFIADPAQRDASDEGFPLGTSLLGVLLRYRPIIRAEGGGGKPVLIPQVDDRIVRPAEADGFGGRDFVAGHDDGFPFDLGGGVVECLVLAGDGEASELPVLGFQPLADVLELDDRLVSFEGGACILGPAGVIFSP